MCARAGPLLTGVAVLCTDLMACSVLLDDGHMVLLATAEATRGMHCFYRRAELGGRASVLASD